MVGNYVTELVQEGRKPEPRFSLASKRVVQSRTVY